MYVDRSPDGSILMAYENQTREGQELLPLDHAELQAWLALPTGQADVTGFDQSKWG